MDTKTIKMVLADYRILKSEYTLLTAFNAPASQDGAALLKKKVDVIEAWFGLMSREERFVVQKHIVDRLSWPYVLSEYTRHWGKPLTRDERSLKRYQAKALGKIVASIDKHALAEEVLSLFGSR